MEENDDVDYHEQQHRRISNPFHDNSDSDEGGDAEDYRSELRDRGGGGRRSISRSVSHSRSRSRSPGPIQAHKVYSSAQLGLSNAGKFAGGLGSAAKRSSVPGGIGEKPAPLYRRINKEDLDWRHVYEPEATDDPGYTFVAHCGQSVAERLKNKDYMKLFSIWDDNYDMVTPIQNATLVQNHYNKFIRPVNPHAKVWLKRSIYNHFAKECPSHGVMRQSWVRVLQRAFMTIANNQLHRINEETGLEEVDFSCLKPMTTILKELRPLLNECSRIHNVY